MFFRKLFTAVLVLIFTFLPTLADAQYFGRYPVQYEDFDFQILHTEHFDIYHYPKEAQAIEDFGKLSERWYLRHSATLNHTFSGDNPMIIYANHADFQQNDIVPSVGVGTGGVTEGLRNRVIMPFAESNASTNHVLGHELVHAFQYDIAKGDKIGSIRATSQLPLWFIEGMAEYLSVGPEDTHTAMWLRDAIQNDDFPSIDDLSNSREYFPYRYGHSVWTFIAGNWGDEVVLDLFVQASNQGIDSAFEEVLDIPKDSVSTLWQNSVQKKYTDDVQNRTRPADVGELVLGEEKDTGSMNVSPALSPNGEYVAFISEKNLFSLDLFLADAETGEIIKKLTSTITDPHLSALRFIESSGSWSPDSERFAAVVFAKGDNQIAIIDISEGEVEERLSFGEVDAITNPAWSPDGNTLAFSGADGGYTDLYLYNMETDSLINVTQDRHSDLQPTWSPDGNRIAFVSDRGSQTNLENLVFGNMKIFELNIESGEVRKIPEFDEAKHINPQYNEDGTSLYYVSDFQGFSDIYRFDFETGQRYRVTSVSTGVSGISKLSPVITVASQTGDLLATVFDDTNYSVYRISEEKKRGQNVSTEPLIADSNQLPGYQSYGNQMVLSYLNNPLTDLPQDTAFALTDYTPTLQLDYVTGGAGAGVSNQFGVGIAGGVTMSFSDMLNQHQLITTLRMQGRIQDVAGQVSYLNRDHRFIWGGSATHQTYRSTRTGISRNDTTTVDGETVVAPTSVIRLNQRIFRERISAIGLYPLTETQRVEFSGGWSYYWYNFEREQIYYTALGQAFKRERIDSNIEEPDPLSLYSTSAAYVSDNSISAFTGPISGHRMRLEAEPTFGSLSYVTALADYRRYFYFQPFTLGFRGMHYARYAQDAEDNRLSPIFLGNERLIRGYNIGSFTAGECSDSAGDTCPEYNRLFGSRLAIANVELRLPVLGAEDLALFRSRTIPTTLSAFFDGGVSWTASREPDLRWTTNETSDNIPVFSTGLSLRVNILGYLITEFYYAVPFQRPDKGGYFGFQISPGW